MPRYRPTLAVWTAVLTIRSAPARFISTARVATPIFRLHGTNEPESIGHAVSSGCIRLFNQDIIDLHNRVPVGTHVMVVQV